MRVHISSIEFDPIGTLVVDALPDSDIRSIRRRVNRVQTLDLGAAVNDRGFSDADRTFVIRWHHNKTQIQTAAYIARTHNRVNVSTDEGVFSAVIESFRPGALESELVLLITERLSS